MPRGTTKARVTRTTKPRSKPVGSAFDRFVGFCKRMCWHLAFTPNTNKFEVFAYERALKTAIEHGAVEGLDKQPGIGASMRKSLAEIIAGRVPAKLAEIEHNGPPFTVSELQVIPGVGPKKALALYEESGITCLDDFKKGITNHKITDPKLIQAYYTLSANNDRVSRELVLRSIQPIVDLLDSYKQAERYTIAGSIRRRRPDIGDIDIIAVFPDDANYKQNIKGFVALLRKRLGDASGVRVSGYKKVEIYIRIAGVERKLDINFIKPKHYGSALVHFTGSYEFNVHLRKLARKRGYKLNQYGAMNLKTEKYRRFADEIDVFRFLGVPDIAPEARDYWNPSVTKEQLDSLITVDDIVGDLHTHTNNSDGQVSLSGITKFKLPDGFVYGVTDHSFGTGNGIPESAIRRHFKQVVSAGFLCGAEVDIKANGKLAYSDDVLRMLDYVILSIHNGDKNPTERYVNAIKHVHELGKPCMIAHPMNRIIGHRPGLLDCDFNTVFRICAETNTVVEINGQPDRLDLPDPLIRKAVKYNCWFAVNSDFHGSTNKQRLALQENAVYQARRGFVRGTDVVNANTKLLQKWLAKTPIN